jgi:hypothetical protein
MSTSLGNPLKNEAIQLPADSLETKYLDLDLEVVNDEQPSSITEPREEKHVHLTQKILNQQTITFSHS